MNSRGRTAHRAVAPITRAACLAWVLGPLHAVAQWPETVTLESCRDDCGLSLVLEAEFGDDTGPGMLDLVGTIGAYRDASKRVYIIGEPIEAVLVFDSTGGFLSRVGRRGSGPGEFEDGASLVVTGDGEFSVLDRGRSAILNFDYTGRLLNEVQTVGEWYPSGVVTHHWDGPWALHLANLFTPERAGYPLHLINVQTGEIGRSFGSATGELRVGARTIPDIAIMGDGRIWMAERPFSKYEVGLWRENERLLMLRRETPWFPERTGPLAHGVEDRPVPIIRAIAASDSLLWVWIRVADEQWRDAKDYADSDRRYDDILEVIDVRSNQVVGSQRFDRAFDHFVEPGLIGRVEITGTASVRFRLYRVVPKVSDREASGR